MRGDRAACKPADRHGGERAGVELAFGADVVEAARETRPPPTSR